MFPQQITVTLLCGVRVKEFEKKILIKEAAKFAASFLFFHLQILTYEKDQLYSISYFNWLCI